MATRDHTARARPSVSPGKAFSDPSDACSPAYSPSAHALCLSRLDEVSLALECLSMLCIEDERCHSALAQHITATELTTLPFPPMIREGVSVAMRCLDEYARELGAGRIANA